MTQSNSVSPAPKWPPKVVVLLDDEMRVLDVNRSLAGGNFVSLTAQSDLCLHAQLHPGCDGKCNFEKMWHSATLTLGSRDSVEWEIDDTVSGRLLRLDLSNMSVPQKVARERRRRHMVLTVTDITKCRQEYTSLLASQQALVKLLLARKTDASVPDDQEYDETGDTGNRMMAEFVNKDRSIARKIVLAQESERKRIASELHDGIAQSIGVMKYKIEATVANLAQQHPQLDLSRFDNVVTDTQSLIEEIRRITDNLAPSVLASFGIRVALEWLCRECTVEKRKVQAHCANDIDEARMPELVKITIYRVVQEALHNVVKHSQATRVDVTLESVDGGAGLIISDNGAGFDWPAEASDRTVQAGLGMRNMRQRVEATGGTFSIQAARGQGVVIRAMWDGSELDLIRE